MVPMGTSRSWPRQVGARLVSAVSRPPAQAVRRNRGTARGDVGISLAVLVPQHRLRTDGGRVGQRGKDVGRISRGGLAPQMDMPSDYQDHRKTYLDRWR